MSPVLSSADLRVGAAPVLSVNRGSAPIWTPGGALTAPEIGAPFEGGFFAGYISLTQDLVPTHALIVAPKSVGQWPTPVSGDTRAKTSNTGTTGQGGRNTADGPGIRDLMIAAGIANFPAQRRCVELNHGGFSDWYLPTSRELEIAYYNLKPSTQSNSTNAFHSGNTYRVPPMVLNYTAQNPAQTSVAAFQAGGAESFELVDGNNNTRWYRTASQQNNSADFMLTFRNGALLENQGKTNNGSYVRAMRRIPVSWSL